MRAESIQRFAYFLLVPSFDFLLHVAGSTRKKKFSKKYGLEKTSTVHLAAHAYQNKKVVSLTRDQSEATRSEHVIL